MSYDLDNYHRRLEREAAEDAENDEEIDTETEDIDAYEYLQLCKNCEEE